MWWWILACERPCERVAWADADGDGAGDPSSPVCEGDGVGVVGDCDDQDATVFPAAVESCDGVDQDCDGWIDDHPDPPLFVDADGDGFGGQALPNCDAWGVEEGGDCDDDDPVLNPQTMWFDDGDGDGAGATELGRSCEPPRAGAVAVGGDCDDADPGRSPLAHELCDDVDQDCDPVNDSFGAWMVPDAAIRVIVDTKGAFDVPLAVALDGAIEPVRVVVQDCADPLELPSTFAPGEGDPWVAGAPTGVGTLFALWDDDGDLATVEPWPLRDVRLGVYFGGSPGPAPTSDLFAGDDALVGSAMTLTVDVAHGGLVAELVDARGLLGGSVDATGGNGLRTGVGPLSVAAFPGDSERLDASAVTAALRATGTASDAEGGFTLTTTWRLFAGRPAALGRATMIADVDTSIVGAGDRTEPLRPLQLRAPGATCTASPNASWGDLSGPQGGVTWVWTAPPRWTNYAGCSAGETWAAGNDLPNGDPGRGAIGNIPGGQAIVDGAVLALLAHGPGGPEAEADRRRAWAEGVVTAVGEPER